MELCIHCIVKRLVAGGLMVIVWKTVNAVNVSHITFHASLKDYVEV